MQFILFCAGGGGRKYWNRTSTVSISLYPFIMKNAFSLTCLRQTLNILFSNVDNLPYCSESELQTIGDEVGRI